MTESSLPPGKKVAAKRDVMLVTAGMFIVANIPTTIETISDPMIKLCAQLMGGLIVLGLGYLTRPSS